MVVGAGVVVLGEGVSVVVVTVVLLGVLIGRRRFAMRNPLRVEDGAGGSVVDVVVVGGVVTGAPLTPPCRRLTKPRFAGRSYSERSAPPFGDGFPPISMSLEFDSVLFSTVLGPLNFETPRLRNLFVFSVLISGVVVSSVSGGDVAFVRRWKLRFGGC